MARRGRHSAPSGLDLVLSKVVSLQRAKGGHARQPKRFVRIDRIVQSPSRTRKPPTYDSDYYRYSRNYFGSRDKRRHSYKSGRSDRVKSLAQNVPEVEENRPFGTEPDRYARDKYGKDAKEREARQSEQRARASTLPYSVPRVVDTPPSEAELDVYARDKYRDRSGKRHVRSEPKRADLTKRIAIGAACVIAVLVLAVGGYALWFSSALNQALAPDREEAEKLGDYLTDAELDKPFYMLLLGSDSREGSGTSSKPAESGDQERSDVMILARIDAPDRTVTLISVPRDTPYTLEDGTVVKINEAYNIGGAAKSIQAVSEVTGVEIAHYAEVHLSGLEAIVDSLGGVEVYVDRELSVKDALTGEKVVIGEGRQTLNGQQAQVFARNRHAYEDSSEGQDKLRQGNVRTLLQAIVKKILAQPITQLPGTVLELAHYITTDLKAGDLVSLAMMFSGGDIVMYSCTGPSDGELVEELGVWLCYPNPEGWAELIRQVDEGVEPGEIDYEATQQSF